MDITVGEGSHIGHSLARLRLFPEGITEDIVLPKDGDNLIVLDDLEGSRDDKTEAINALSSVVEKVPRSAAICR